MYIRSQDKKKLINTNICHLIITSDNRISAVHNTTGFPSEIESGCIGKYSTEEKVIKVMDMICDTCRNIAFVDEGAIVFQMPLDSEV